MRPQTTALIVAAALFMENIDSTVIATSLPAIAADLGTDPIKLKLALTSYLISLAVFIPVSGWMADRYGARNVFRAAIAVFMVGSLACSLADSLGSFVLARILQGMGGAMMVPVGRLLILRTTPKAELLSALAWLTVPALFGPLIGPPLGGFITTYGDWRWIFLINIPVGLVGILLATIFIEPVAEPSPPPLDRVGFVLSGIGLSGLVFGLSVMGQGMLPLAASGGMVLAGAVATVLYLVHGRRTAHPLLDLTLMRLPTFNAAMTGGYLFRIGVGAVPFLLPLSLQLGLGMTPFESGSLTFLAAVGALLMKVTAKPIVSRFGFRRVLVANGIVSAAFLGGLGLFGLDAVGFAFMVGVLVFGGFFRSLQFTCLNAMAYADVDEARMSRATSLYSVGQQISLASGVAVAGAILEAQRYARGGTELVSGDFLVAFLVVSAVSALSVLIFARLPADAGSALAAPSARRGAATREPAAAE